METDKKLTWDEKLVIRVQESLYNGGVTLLVIKLTGIIDVSWWLILSLILGPTGIILVLLAITLVITELRK